VVVPILVVVNLTSIYLGIEAVRSQTTTLPVAPGDRRERPPLTSRVTFATPAQAERRRQKLLRYVFGEARLPKSLPNVTRRIRDIEFAEGVTNLARIDRLTIAMPLGFTSVAYHLIPRRANGRLLIYHNGHNEDLDAGKGTIAYFLERGYALLVFAMPFAGVNTNPEAIVTRCGLVRLEFEPTLYHDTMGCLPRPHRYFVEPIAVALNYAQRLRYGLVAMTGLSGGGWATMLYAALDSRVRLSYPVAGARPHYITARRCPGDTSTSVRRCFDDFEQRDPGLYRIANHLELYTLGSWGKGRKQVSINNVYDPCCLTGTSYLEWRPIVQAALRRLGTGAFDAAGDRTHREHAISAFTLKLIQADLRRASAGSSH
jgi:hypothetical protein